MYLLESQGSIVGDHGERALEPGVGMWVPPHERHQFKNTGTTPLKFICSVPQRKP